MTTPRSAGWTWRPAGHPPVAPGRLVVRRVRRPRQPECVGPHRQHVACWDGPTGRPAGLQMPHPDSVIRSMGLSADGRLAVSGTDMGSARLWDLATGQPVGRLPDHHTYIWAAWFRPDGRMGGHWAERGHVPLGRSRPGGRQLAAGPPADRAANPPAPRGIRPHPRPDGRRAGPGCRPSPRGGVQRPCRGGGRSADQAAVPCENPAKVPLGFRDVARTIWCPARPAADRGPTQTAKTRSTPMRPASPRRTTLLRQLIDRPELSFLMEAPQQPIDRNAGYREAGEKVCPKARMFRRWMSRSSRKYPCMGRGFRSGMGNRPKSNSRTFRVGGRGRRFRGRAMPWVRKRRNLRPLPPMASSPTGLLLDHPAVGLHDAAELGVEARWRREDPGVTSSRGMRSWTTQKSPVGGCRRDGSGPCTARSRRHRCPARPGPRRTAGRGRAPPSGRTRRTGRGRGELDHLVRATGVVRPHDALGPDPQYLSYPVRVDVREVGEHAAFEG